MFAVHFCLSEGWSGRSEELYDMRTSMDRSTTCRRPRQWVAVEEQLFFWSGTFSDIVLHCGETKGEPSKNVNSSCPYMLSPSRCLGSWNIGDFCGHFSAEGIDHEDSTLFLEVTLTAEKQEMIMKQIKQNRLRGRVSEISGG